MGVFTDQVQNLASEAKNARLEKQQKEYIKIKKENVKKELHFILSSYFTDVNIQEYNDIYYKLITDHEKWRIIGEITKNEQLEYYLDTIYLKELNNVKQGYFIQFKQYQKEQKEAEEIQKIEAERERQEAEERDERTQATYNLLIKIFMIPLIIILAPIILILYIIIGLAKES